MELGPRDILSRSFVHEMRAGRVFEDEQGQYVHLDLRHLGEKVIDEKLPFVRELTRNYVGIDPVHDPIPVRPVVHYMMGGVHTDIDGKTPIEGLYAAGECACVSLNGANRLGSNSLTECLVFGARAGKTAAGYAMEQQHPTLGVLDQLTRDEELQIKSRFFSESAEEERIADIRTDLQKTMEAGAGIYRTREGLQKACDEIAGLRRRYGNVRVQDQSGVFNTQLTAALELGFMLDVAESLVHSALGREESRGSHARSDFEERNDDAFLQHSLSHRSAEEEDPPHIDYLPATITGWQPEERMY